jgi:glycosyltransferase 2 family protein
MKRWLSLILKIGVSVGILAVIAAKTDVQKIAGLLGSVSGTTVCVVALLSLLQTVVTSYRWVLVMRGLGVSLEPWPALQAVYVSLALNQCMPSYVGGDAYRVYWLYREGNRLALAARGVLIDRISAVIALVVMMAAGLPLVFTRFADPAARHGLVGVLACGLLGTAVFFSCDAVPRAWRRLRVVRELAELSAAARRLLLHGSDGLVIGPLALLVHVLTASVMFSFAEALGLPLTWLDCVLLTPPIMLLAAVPISIAGWGVREGVMVGALSMVGIGTESALALSVLLGVTALANGLVGLLPLTLGGERFVATRTQYAAER